MGSKTRERNKIVRNDASMRVNQAKARRDALPLLRAVEVCKIMIIGLSRKFAMALRIPKDANWTGASGSRARVIVCSGSPNAMTISDRDKGSKRRNSWPSVGGV